MDFYEVEKLELDCFYRFCGVTLSVGGMGKKIELIVVLTTFLCFCELISQELDTLYHFNETDSLDIIIVLDGVTDFGVRFTPAQNWDYYNIKKIEFFVPSLSPYNDWFEINNADNGSYPGSTFKRFWITFNDSNDVHPRWYSYVFSDIDSLNNRSGEFWVTGVALFSTHVSLSSYSGNTFAFWDFFQPCAPCWGEDPVHDITIRTILERTDSTVSVLDDSFKPIYKNPMSISNYPNPFNDQTTFQVDLPAAGKVSISIFDLLGRQVLNNTANTISCGQYQFVWDTRNRLAAGIYLYQVSFTSPGRFTPLMKTGKLIYLK